MATRPSPTSLAALRPSSSDPYGGRSEDSIKAITQRFDVGIVFKLSLASKGLPSISCLENCINLTDLDLSNNAISKIEGLDSLAELRRLNLSSNRLTHVGGLGALLKLQQLRLQGNQISTEKGLGLELLSALPALRTLYFQTADHSATNAACRAPGYKQSVLRQLPGLSNLDGERTPHSLSYSEVVDEVNEALCDPPEPLEPALPEAARWFPEPEAGHGLNARDLVPAEVQEGAARVLKGVDECHALMEVLSEEVRKAQAQLLGTAAKG